MRKLWGVAVFAVACSTQDGEGWAKKTFGEQAAENLRSEAAQRAGLGSLASAIEPTQKAEVRPYLPKPYVVFTVKVDETKGEAPPSLVYTKLNERRAQDFGAGGAKAFVLLDQNEIIENVRKSRGRTLVKSHVEVDVVIIDRQTGKVSKAHAARADDVPQVLDALPEAP